MNAKTTDPQGVTDRIYRIYYTKTPVEGLLAGLDLDCSFPVIGEYMRDVTLARLQSGALFHDCATGNGYRVKDARAELQAELGATEGVIV